MMTITACSYCNGSRSVSAQHIKIAAFYPDSENAKCSFPCFSHLNIAIFSVLPLLEFRGLREHRYKKTKKEAQVRRFVSFPFCRCMPGLRLTH